MGLGGHSTPSNATRVGLVADKEHTRRSVVRALGELPGRHELEIYGTALDAFRRIPLDTLGLVLVATLLPDWSGIACAAKLKAMLPCLRILMLSSSGLAEEVVPAFLAGACGYISVASPREIALHISSALQGHFTFSPEGEDILLRALQPAPGRPTADGLTSRELQIIGYALAKRSDKEIAESLGIAPGTVHTHFTSIFRKLGVSTREQAARKFLQLSKSKPASDRMSAFSS